MIMCFDAPDQLNYITFNQSYVMFSKHKARIFALRTALPVHLPAQI